MLSQILDDIQKHRRFHSEPKIWDILKTHECWLPFLKNLDRGLVQNPISWSIYREAIIVCLYFYPQHRLALEYTKKLFEHAHPSMEEFELEILSHLPLEDREKSNYLFDLEAIIPKSIQISYWTYLTRFCEKKIHNYEKLGDIQKKILKENPKNFEALVYFKNHGIQNNLEEKVIASFFGIIDGLHDKPYKKQKFAYELSNYYFYQMNEPSKAIDVLEKHSIDLQLPHYQLLYEAAFDLKNWEKSLYYLDQILASLNTDQAYQKALTFYEKGLVFQKMGQDMKSLELFQKAHDEMPGFFQPLEAMTDVAIKRNDHFLLEKIVDRILLHIPDDDKTKESFIQMKKNFAKN